MKATIATGLLVLATVAYSYSLYWVSGTSSPIHLVGGTIAWGFVASVVIAWIASIIWAFLDARRRNKPGFLVALMVAVLAWPAGLIAWLLFPPANRIQYA
jgi:hypothetical protein